MLGPQSHQPESFFSQIKPQLSQILKHEVPPMILNILHKVCVGNRTATIRLGNSPNIAPLLNSLGFCQL